MSVVRRVLLWSCGERVTEQMLREVFTFMKRRPEAKTAHFSINQRAVVPSAPEERPFRERVAELLAKADRGEVAKIEAILSDEVERELYGQAIRLAAGNQSQA